MKTVNKLTCKSILVVMLLLLLTACGLSVVQGSGNIQTEARPVSGFDRVMFAGNGELVITQGDTESLTVEADDNLLPLIKTEVKNGELFIGFDKEDWDTFYRPSQPIRFNLALDDLSALTLSGSGRATMAELIADHLLIEVSGSGSVEVDQLQASDLSLVLSGSGQVELSGQATLQEVGISGSGTYHGGDLESQTASVSSSGSGSGTLWVRESLEAKLSGSGSVSYYGSPAVTSESSGSGSLTSLGEK